MTSRLLFLQDRLKALDNLSLCGYLGQSVQMAIFWLIQQKKPIFYNLDHIDSFDIGDFGNRYYQTGKFYNYL